MNFRTVARFVQCTSLPNHFRTLSLWYVAPMGELIKPVICLSCENARIRRENAIGYEKLLSPSECRPRQKRNLSPWPIFWFRKKAKPMRFLTVTPIQTNQTDKGPICPSFQAINISEYQVLSPNPHHSPINSITLGLSSASLQVRTAIR